MKHIVFLIALLFSIFTGLLIYQGKTAKKEEPAIVNPASVSEISEVTSIEGTFKLAMTKRPEQNGSTSYSFAVSDKSGKKTQIFNKNAAAGESMNLHHNSWSPNNKYVILEDKTSNTINYLVLKADGENFLNGEKYFNVTALFPQKVKNYTFSEATGWDDPVLVSVRTVKGPHFWFDVTTQSFIQLAR